jgi:hypothetical protein
MFMADLGSQHDRAGDEIWVTAKPCFTTGFPLQWEVDRNEMERVTEHNSQRDILHNNVLLTADRESDLSVVHH